MATFYNAHTENIPYWFGRCHTVQHFWLMFETFVNGKGVNVTSMKFKKDLVLLDNAKDFESDPIFDFIILLAKFSYIN